jgi:hypothetical protein
MIRRSCSEQQWACHRDADIVGAVPGDILRAFKGRGLRAPPGPVLHGPPSYFTVE